jgi:hypothetical protein
MACGPAWRRAELNPQPQLAPRQQVQVWISDGRTRVLHALVIDSAHVRGVPFDLPAECDSCRISIPRREVDSLRLGSMTEGFLGGLIGVGFALAVLTWALTVTWM